MTDTGPPPASSPVDGPDGPEDSDDPGPDVDSVSPAADGTRAALVVGLGDGERLPRWVWRLIVAVAVSVALFDASLSMLAKLTSLIGMIVVALFLSFAIEPAVSFFSDRYGIRRGLGTFGCFAALGIVSVLFVFVMAELVVSQVSDLLENAPDYLDQAARWADDTFGLDIDTGEVNDLLTDYQDDIATIAADVGGRVLSLTGSLVGFVFQAFTVALFAFYMTAQGPQMRRNVCSVLPAERQHNVLYLWELSIQKTGGWIYSRLLLAALSATCTWIFLRILGVPSPLALALWVGLVSQFIPAIGTYLAGALPVLIALLNDPVDALWVLGFIIVYQQIENYFFSPKITASTMDLHPAVAFGSAIAGGFLAGPIGAILALPAAGVIQAFVSTFLERHEVVASHLTDLDHIRRTQGESGMRKAMRRILRREDPAPESTSGVGASAPVGDAGGVGDDQPGGEEPSGRP